MLFRSHGQHAARVAFADGFDVAALLEQLAADVQRQIGRIHHAFDKAQIARQQLLGVVHDEHAPHVELDAGFLRAVPQVLRGVLRDVEPACIRRCLPRGCGSRPAAAASRAPGVCRSLRIARR